MIAVALTRGVQPLQQCLNPLWKYNGSDDATRTIREGFENHSALAAALEAIYKGEKEDFAQQQMFDGFSYFKPIEAVSAFYPTTQVTWAGFSYY